MVRDEDTWCWLSPADGLAERFALIAFHFPPDVDNSGFVGRLATALRSELDTGVFVVCGQNSGRGGTYDYRGRPAELAEQAAAVIERLRGQD